MAFRTKLDFSSNRQVKQHEKTITALSGGTSFGLPYSAMTSGPDLTTSGVSETLTAIASTFSGNSGTTNYTWYDSRMSLGESELSAITPTISSTTQQTNVIFTANTSTIIDGNFVALSYSGVSFDLSVIAMYDLGGGAYSGTVLTNTLDVLSATSLDYTGRTIWNDVSGITRTDRLIISNNPQVGYVWTCLDSEGMGEWQYNGSSSGSTIWTAGTGISSAVLGGSNGIASGDTSVSEGSYNIAGGYSSHAEGDNTLAIGDITHTEGTYTIANGYASHAEGAFTTSNGNYSHAEGNYTIADGGTSHAEGYNTTASGNMSHSEGRLTIASGHYSHAGGYSSTADGEVAFIHSYSSSTLNSNQSAILGGRNLYISDSDYSGMLGGYGNNIGLGEAGFSLNAEHVVILGGINNIIYEGTAASSILGGGYNKIHKYSNYSSLVGGQYNEITGSSINSGIFVGTGNTITNTSKNAAIIAGQNNTISGHSNSVIVGGSSNFIDFCLNNYGTSANETIIGGAGNEMYTADNSFIAGGLYNLIDGRTAGIGSDGSFVIGSFMSSAFTSNNSGILGGWKNAILSSDCSYITNTLILGGEENTYNPYGGAGVGTGGNNLILGGSNNKLSGSSILKSAIIAGSNNVIVSNISNSVILGGTAITATTDDTVYMNNLYVTESNGNFYTNITGTTENSTILSGKSSSLTFLEAKTVDSSSIRFGVRGGTISPSTFDEYGKVNDSFLYSSINNNGLNIISADGVGTEDYIRFYAGQNAEAINTPDIHIHGTGATRGYVGINIENPTERLHVNGSLRVVDGTQQDGYVFTSDANGKGSWQENPLGVFMAAKAPEAIPIGSLIAKGIPDGQVITGYTSIYYNDTDISGTLTTPFGTFNNTTGLFTTNTDCVLNIQSWVHLKASTDSLTAWTTTDICQIGLGICPNNTTDIHVGDFLTILPSVSRGLDISTGITIRVLSGSSFRVKILNQTDRAYLGSGFVSGDYLRFNITRIA